MTSFLSTSFDAGVRSASFGQSVAPKDAGEARGLD